MTPVSYLCEVAIGTTITTEKQWGGLVRDRRKFLGLSQAALAERCEISQTSVSRIEKGQVVARDRTKVRISAALRANVTDLFPYPDIWD